MAFTGKGKQAPPTKNEPLQKVSVMLKRFLYKNEESGFYFAACEVPAGEPSVTGSINGKVFEGRKFIIEGTSEIVINGIAEGQIIDVYGKFEKGREEGDVKFVVNSLEEKIPSKPSSIALFLGSGKITGVGPKIAHKIVEMFGAKTIDVLDSEPKKLLSVPGINEKKLEIIIKDWKDWRSKYEILATLRVYEISDTNGIKIFEEFGEKSMQVIKHDPYKLTEVKGIGFHSADRIARAGGTELVDPTRIKMCIKYLLRQIAENGNTASPTALLVKEAEKVLGVAPVLIEEYINELAENHEIIAKQVKMRVGGTRENPQYQYYDGFADAKIHFTEIKIAKDIARIATSPLTNYSKKKIEEFVEFNEHKLDPSQLKSVEGIFESKISVLTGGPGTGKTHTTKAIIDFYKKSGLEVVLAAPTGRAAQRMKEATNAESETLHRKLGYSGSGFTFNSENQLEGDVFIIDETSMVDIWLAKAILSAVPDHARVLFIGDIDQLASVGPGAFLRDLIESGMINVARLTELHRTSANSNINLEARNVIAQKMPNLYDYNSKSDFVFVEENSEEAIKEKILDIVSELAVDAESNLKAIDIQILTPRKDTLVGVNNLNMELRPLLNPSFALYNGIEFKYMPGDRVMQFKNDKDLKVYNGDVGVVSGVNEEEGEMSVMFSDQKVEIPANKVCNINFSYATTVHKSQGSDYPVVIIPLSSKHIFMWDCNLLYTAMTRGKKRVILVGEKKALQASVSAYKQKYRITGLQEQLKEFLDTSKQMKEDPFYEQWLAEDFEAQLEHDILVEKKNAKLAV